VGGETGQKYQAPADRPTASQTTTTTTTTTQVVHGQVAE